MSNYYTSSRRYRPYDYKSKLRRNILRFFLVILLVFIVFQVVDHFFLQTYSVKDDSMLPYLSTNDKILTTSLMYGPRIPFSKSFFSGFRTPVRGEIVICRPGYYEAPPAIVSIVDKCVRFFTLQKVSLVKRFYFPSVASLTVKRIVGLPGDTIKMDDFVVYIKPEGKEFFFHEIELAVEEYETVKGELPEDWTADLPFSGNFTDIVLGDDEYFVIGDNRAGSLDSRHWGPIPRSHLEGSLVLKYWPFREFHL